MSSNAPTLRALAAVAGAAATVGSVELFTALNTAKATLALVLVVLAVALALCLAVTTLLRTRGRELLLTLVAALLVALTTLATKALVLAVVALLLLLGLDAARSAVSTLALLLALVLVLCRSEQTSTDSPIAFFAKLMIWSISYEMIVEIRRKVKEEGPTRRGSWSSDARAPTHMKHSSPT
jgi:hypothetical protein